jgi:hypothetical protein
MSLGNNGLAETSKLLMRYKLVIVGVRGNA